MGHKKSTIGNRDTSDNATHLGSAQETQVDAPLVATEHLDCGRAYIDKLEAEGVIKRKAMATRSIGGVAYLRYRLRHVFGSKPLDRGRRASHEYCATTPCSFSSR